MPELRRDPVIGRWVIISTERSRRPGGFSAMRENQGSVPCPFCPGNESKTPPEILAYGGKGRGPNTPGWNLRVIPNKYPALQIEGDLHRSGEDLFDRMDGLGAHEVIVETEDHSRQLEDLDEARVAEVFSAWRERIYDLKRDPRFEYILVFKNRGSAAGASLSHAHSQLIATPMVPIRVKQELRGAEEYFEQKGRCIFCEILRAELEKRERVIEVNDDFAVIAPFASRFPFEMWILPRTHASDFEGASDAQLRSLSQTLKSVLNRLNNVLDHPPYNFIVHTSPLKASRLAHFHWHIELMPKIVHTAGFEWGAGFYINPTPPEQAAQYLREANSRPTAE
ncbi:MAG: galactose-1-phosphate uridylyltransferase [Elusimicrobia bacterium]|nr:galactose-1-phosphate uridylyltransferase [Elusimicrobiota bacterium]